MLTVLASGGVSDGIRVSAEALKSGRCALDAVEAGIRQVELDRGNRSVGIAGSPNMLGQVELDACIMDGRGLRAGAVGALRGYLHPISVAREVMERLPHVFLVGEGAARFASECGAEPGRESPEAIAEWQDWLRDHAPTEALDRWPNAPLARLVNLTLTPRLATGTTVFMARDAAGDIAIGVSTSGWRYKYPGRLGDSPVIGAGAYADNRYGAAGCTGHGEFSIRAGTARSVVLYMKMGMPVEEACREAARDARALDRAYQGGLIIYAFDQRGHPCVVTTEGGQAGYLFWQTGLPEPESRLAPGEPSGA